MDFTGGHRIVTTAFSIRAAPAANAVPAGRIGYDLDADHLLLHTVQPTAVVDVLAAGGVFRPDPKLTWPEFAEAYEWMYRQMAARLPTRGDGAIWLWAHTRRLDLTDSCRRARGDVLLTCRVPRERVLLSHYDDWHHVLNRWLNVPLVTVDGETEEDAWARWETSMDAFTSRLDKERLRDRPVSEWPHDLRAEIEASWEPIFDRSNYRSRGECWQATMHTLHPNDVIDAVHIQ